MTRKLVKELLVPAEHGKAWRVDKGQILRIIAIDGPQVGDLATFNAHNYREVYDPDWSYVRNWRLGTGDGNRIRYLLSRPPWYNTMLEVIDDKVGTHWIHCGGKCNPKTFELAGVEGTVRSCQTNLAEAIQEFGMTPEDVPDVFNLWMNVEYTPERGMNVMPALCEKGDFIDFLAHMDCLMALSACPGNQGNVTPINDGANKPLKVEVYEET